MDHGGEVAAPATGVPNRGHDVARRNIEVIGILRDKTRGNLDNEESKLMEALLYDRRTKFLTPSGDGCNR